MFDANGGGLILGSHTVAIRFDSIILYSLSSIYIYVLLYTRSQVLYRVPPFSGVGVVEWQLNSSLCQVCHKLRGERTHCC